MLKNNDNVKRCAWAQSEPLKTYHDTEWGAPTRDEAKLYEMLLLEAFQAGLSWRIILSKREAFRRAFDGFDPHKIAAYGEAKIDELTRDAGIIRSRNKISAAVTNARVYLDIVSEFGSFAAYMDSFTHGVIPVNRTDEFVTTTELSDVMSADLRRRGMRYMGSVTLYSYLQAVGVVNDHETGCFLHPDNKDGAK